MAAAKGNLLLTLFAAPQEAMATVLLVLGLLLGLYALLYYNCIKGAKCRAQTSLQGKTVVITGEGERGQVPPGTLGGYLGSGRVSLFKSGKPPAPSSGQGL